MPPEEESVNVGVFWLNVFPPDLQFVISPEPGLRGVQDSYYQRCDVGEPAQSVQQGLPQHYGDDIRVDAVSFEALAERQRAKDTVDFLPPLASLDSKTMEQARNNNAADTVLQLFKADDELLAQQEEDDSELKKESSTVKRDGTLLDKSTDSTAGGDFTLSEQEISSGESQETLQSPQHDNAVEQHNELTLDPEMEEQDALAPAKPIGSGKLTYNFGRWGEGHQVDVTLLNQEQDTHFQFEPSDSLVEQRMTEQWEQTDIPPYWSLLEDAGGEHQGHQQKGQDEIDDEVGQ
ncbi:antigen presentation protein SpaN [Serratia fonticola]|nr:antigen presentation protein SpaN [Serratia fonticola]